jgi:hypothetical protein
MWLFATPLMLKLYTEINHLKLKDINFLYHFIPCLVYLFIFPYKNNYNIYYIYFGLSTLFMFLFIRTLTKFGHLKFTKIFISIWFIFSILHIIEFTKILDVYKLNILFLTCDMLGKVVTNFVVYDYMEQKYIIKNNIDLQSLNLIKYLLYKVKNYEKHNKRKSVECINFIKYVIKKFKNLIPEKNNELQIELLQKILPLGFEKKYIKNDNDNTNDNNDNTNDNNDNTNDNNKEFNNICVLFVDIVSYTELSQKYEDKVIFNLLNNIYIKFDNIIK